MLNDKKNFSTFKFKKEQRPWISFKAKKDAATQDAQGKEATGAVDAGPLIKNLS